MVLRVRKTKPVEICSSGTVLHGLLPLRILGTRIARDVLNMLIFFELLIP